MVAVTAIFSMSPPTSGVKLKSSLITSTGVMSSGATFGGLLVASVTLAGLLGKLDSFLDSESFVDIDD